jgi:hypothetical protein
VVGISLQCCSEGRRNTARGRWEESEVCFKIGGTAPDSYIRKDLWILFTIVKQKDNQRIDVSKVTWREDLQVVKISPSVIIITQDMVPAPSVANGIDTAVSTQQA